MTEELGYRRYGAGGGDGGSPISQILGVRHPDSIIGLHLTDIGFPILMANFPDLSDAEREYLAASQTRGFEEGAYAVLQGTKPQTLAYGLNDAPAGYAAWIIEKFRTNMPARFDFAEGEPMLCGCLFDIDEKTVRRAAATVESLPELTPAELLLQICCKTSGRGGALSQICLKAFAAARCYKSAPTLSARRDGALCQICVKTFRRRATCPKSVPRLLVATGHLVKSLSRLLTAAPQFQMSSRTFRRLIARRVRKPMK